MINSASKVILYDDQGFLVMQQRDAGSKAKNKRTFFGGGIEKGESPKAAALRELEEETSKRQWTN